MDLTRTTSLCTANPEGREPRRIPIGCTLVWLAPSSLHENSDPEFHGSSRDAALDRGPWHRPRRRPDGPERTIRSRVFEAAAPSPAPAAGRADCLRARD